MKHTIIKGKLIPIDESKPILDYHPLLKAPIRQAKVQSVAIPENRPSINEWFAKHF